MSRNFTEEIREVLHTHLPPAFSDAGTLIATNDPLGCKIEGTDIDHHEALLHSLIKIWPTSNISRTHCEDALLELYPTPFRVPEPQYKALLGGETLKLNRLMGHVRRAWRRTPTGGRGSVSRLKAVLSALQPIDATWPSLPSKRDEAAWPDFPVSVGCDSGDEDDVHDAKTKAADAAHLIEISDDDAMDSPQSVPQDHPTNSQTRVDPGAVATETSKAAPPRYNALKKCLRKPASALNAYDTFIGATKKTKATGKAQKKGKTKATAQAHIHSKPGSTHWQNRWRHILDRLPPALRFDKTESHGEYSYSVKSQKTKDLAIQVLLRSKSYFIKGGSMPDGRTTVVWSRHAGSPIAAFREICRTIRF